MKLFYHPASTYSRRVQVMLLEKDLPCELVALDLPGREHKSEWYAQLNPYTRVPTLQDGSLVLYESSTILTYLEAAYPSPPLVPADLAGRAMVDMHMRLCDAQLGRYAGIILFPKRFLPPERWDRSAMDAAGQEISKQLAIVDQQLGSDPYLVGQHFSLADIAYLPFLHFLQLMEVQVSARVRAWADRLLARPSAKATVPAR